MDVEKFEKLVLEVRTVAISRPANLTKFAETHYKSSRGKYLSWEAKIVPFRKKVFPKKIIEF